MKTRTEIKDRIKLFEEKKKEVLNLYIQAKNEEQRDYYTSEIMSYNFMITELQWVLK